MSAQTDNGRAFEWAVGQAIHLQTGFPIKEGAYPQNADIAFERQTAKKKQVFNSAAKVAIENILNKEGSFITSNAVGYIEFNDDSAGIQGDVRDVLLKVGGRTIGFSCKNNHEALKHSRLSATVDFIKKWGIDSGGCSQIYWDKVLPLFGELKEIRDQSRATFLWSNIDKKAETYYWPILNAWADELLRVCEISPEMQKALGVAIISYLVGKHDFYKIICEKSESVHIQGWNFNKTLATKQTKYPDTIIAINDRNGGQYSKTVVFNHGYQINFRIHSASSRVEPSLKFDINAIGLPTSEVYQQVLDIPKG